MGTIIKRNRNVGSVDGAGGKGDFGRRRTGRRCGGKIPDMGGGLGQDRCGSGLRGLGWCLGDESLRCEKREESVGKDTSHADNGLLIFAQT
jgi:hypothetical protein